MKTDNFSMDAYRRRVAASALVGAGAASAVLVVVLAVVGWLR